MQPLSSGAHWFMAVGFFRWGQWANVHVLSRLAGFLGWLARDTCKASLAGAMGTSVEAMAAADLGNTSRSLDLVEKMLELALAADATVCHWFFINVAVDVSINGGRYRQALAVHERWAVEARERGRTAAPVAFAFAQVNQAEALHNLGRNAEALDLLARIESECKPDSLATHGLWTLRAWILAHDGQPQAAREAMAHVSRAPLGPRYHAEFHYTRAAIARELGDNELAWRESRLGLRGARRAASVRNGLHMLASIATVRGDCEVALRYLQRATACRYQGQAAPYLLLLGTTYDRLGRSEDARLAFANAVAGDPESYAAQEAGERLQKSTAEQGPG